MHNLPMHRPNSLLRPGLRPLAAVLLALLLAVSACGGGDDAEPAANSSSESDASDGGTAEEAPTAEEPYLPVPDGVELTAQGSPLDVGDKAVVAYEPRQDVVGALEITVTRLEDADFDQFVGWDAHARDPQDQPLLRRGHGEERRRHRPRWSGTCRSTPWTARTG